MTRYTIQPLLALGLISTVGFAGTSAAVNTPSVHYQSADQGHHVLIDGTSNIHDWYGVTEQIEGWIKVPGQWLDDDDDGWRLEPAVEWDDAHATISVRIPVESLEGNRRGLASNMHDALDASDHPYITFEFDGPATEAPTVSGSSATSAITGDLTVSGVTRPVDLELHVDQPSNDRLRIRVDEPLTMTMFDIDPPTALLGMARAADEIDVEVTWIVERSTPQPTAPQADVPTEHRETVTALVDAYMMMYEGVRDLDRETAVEGVREGGQHVTALESLESDDLPDADAWNHRVQTLADAVQAIGDAETGSAIRQALADTSDVLLEILETAGHADASTLMAYRYPDLQNVEGRVWLQPYGADIDVESPYGGDMDDGPEIVAIFPGADAGQ